MTFKGPPNINKDVILKELKIKKVIQLKTRENNYLTTRENIISSQLPDDGTDIGPNSSGGN